jgi:23S rRNA pseudouridine2605 synthase
MQKQRLSKVLATAGIASRRACEQIICDGKVSVNGVIATVPQTMVDATSDVITVEGKRISQPAPKVYFALHKPVGFTCTNAPNVKKRVVDLVTCPKTRLFTIGRLDKETSGLILLTNDGHFAHRVMHPSGNITKEYIAKVDQELTHEHLVKLSEGCRIDGAYVKPVSVKKIRRNTLKIAVAEGRHHEVREFIAAAGLFTLELKRVRIGGLTLGTLPVGTSRALTKREIEGSFPISEQQKKGTEY